MSGKKVHSGWGIALGLIGIVVALLGGFFFGNVGAIVAGVLGLIAVLIGVYALSKGSKGKGAVIAGILAIVIAFSIASTMNNLIKEAQKQALEHADIAPTWAKYAGEAKTNMGFYGLVSKLAEGEEADLQVILDEFSELNKLNNAETSEAAAQ